MLLAKKKFDFYGKIYFIKVFRLHLRLNGEATGIDFIMMADRRGKKSNKLNYILKAIELIQKKKVG